MTCVDATLDIMAIIYATETNRGRRELLFKKTRIKKENKFQVFIKMDVEREGGKDNFLS